MTSATQKKVAVGVAWTTAARAGVRALGFLSTLFLARLLAPADFGLVAMAMVVASGLELLTLFNFDMALVQTPTLTRAHYDSAWTLNCLMGLGLALTLVAAAAPVADFYHEPRLRGIMIVIAFKYVIDSAGNPGTVDFRRSINFRPDFYMQVGPKIAGVVVTVALAFWLRDYRALLAGMVLTSCVSCILSYVLHTHRPTWCLVEAPGLFRFSRWLLLNNFVGFLRTRSADLIIGRTLGPAALGVFSVASEIASLPSTEMVAPINRVLFPSYVHLAKEPERLRESFRMTLGLITLLILPVCIGLAALADPFVQLVLGAKWLETVPLISMLAIAGGAIVLQATTGSVYNALGLPRMIALTGAIHAVTLIVLLLLAAPRYGMMGVAWATLFHSVCIGLLVTYALFISATPIRIADVFGTCWRPVVGCAVMFGFISWAGSVLPSDGTVASHALHLGAGTVLGAVTYSLAVYLLWTAVGRPEGAEASLLERWKNRRQA